MEDTTTTDQHERSDPRVFFASERTQLAWLRTGIAVIGLGFLVARFGYFLAILKGTLASGGHRTSTGIGVTLVLLGVSMILASAWQQKRFVRALSRYEVPRSYSTIHSVLFSVLLAGSGLILAIYLLIVSDHRSVGTTGDNHSNVSPPAGSAGQ